MDSKKGLKFRPQDYNRKSWLKWHRNSGEYHGIYNWQQNYSDKFWRKHYWPRVYKVGTHLHYLACHAPKNVRVKWYSAWLRFSKQHPKA